MENLDDWITGTNNTDNPANQPDSTDDQIESLEDAFNENDSDRFFEILSEIRNEVKSLRNTAGLCQNQYLKKKLNNVYQKL